MRKEIERPVSVKRRIVIKRKYCDRCNYNSGSWINYEVEMKDGGKYNICGYCYNGKTGLELIVSDMLYTNRIKRAVLSGFR